VDLAAGGEVHDGVRSPTDGPNHLFDFFVNVGPDNGVPDVGVDLDQKIPANDHRFGFGMVDIGRNDGSPASYFVANKFRRDFVGNGSSEGFTVASLVSKIG
jgi:hypothetical protein